MPYYENVFIARQDISASAVDGLADRLIGVIKENGGEVTKKEYWGLRNLAYKIKKNRKGHYVLMNVDAPIAAVQEMERQMRINEDVLRFLTLRVDELEEGPSAMMQARSSRDDRGRRDGRGGFGRDRGAPGGDGRRGENRPAPDASGTPPQATPQVTPEAASKAAAETPAQAKPETKTEAQAETKPEAPAETKTEAPAETKPEAPAEIKTEAPAETKTEAPAETKTEAPAEASTDGGKE